MTEELDLSGQDSDAGSEEVVLTPAELIDRLEQVSSPNRIALLQTQPFYLVQLCRCQESGNEMELEAYFKRRETASYHLHRNRK